MMAKLREVFTRIGFGMPKESIDPVVHEKLKRQSLSHEEQLEAQLSALRLEMRGSAASRVRDPRTFLGDRSGDH